MVQGRYAKVNRRKRRKKKIFVTIAFLITVAAIATVVCLAMFFNIEKMNVAGLLRYEAEEIITAIGVEVGDNIFAVDDNAIEEMLCKDFPYIEKVDVVRLLPTTIEFVVTEVDPAYAMISDGTHYTLISEQMKVLEHKEGRSIEGVPIVVGMDLTNIEQGTKIKEVYESVQYQTEDEFKERKEQYRLVMESLYTVKNVDTVVKKIEFDDISYYDVSDPLTVSILYDDRIIIELGSELELEYKFAFAKTVLDELSDSYSGTIDLQTAGNNQRAYTREINIVSLLNEDYLEGYY